MPLFYATIENKKLNDIGMSIEAQVQRKASHRYHAWLKKSKPFDANDSAFVLYINIIDQDPLEIKSVQLYFTITEKKFAILCIDRTVSNQSVYR